MKAQPFLCFNGYEVVNSLRTMNYIRRGLVDSRWAAAVNAPISGSGYQDTFADTYSADPFSPTELVGYCAAIDFSAETASGGYVSPVADDAPWYQASRPESGEFMGLTLRDLQLPPAMARAVQVSGPVGAALGRLSTRQRIVAVTATMYASTERGMAYGERWLADVLSGNQCDPLSDLGDLVVLPACGAGFRTLKQAGLVDGPVFSQLGSNDSIPSCVSQQVDFQFACGLPWLFADPTTLAAANLTAGGSVSGKAVTESWLGDAGIRVTVTPTSLFTGTITLTPLPAGYTCPTAGLSPAISCVVSGVPAGDVWTWDSAARTILEWEQSGKRYISGFPRVSVVGGFSWLEIPPCSSVCVTVGATTGTAGVTIEQINREL